MRCAIEIYVLLLLTSQLLLADVSTVEVSMLARRNILMTVTVQKPAPVRHAYSLHSFKRRVADSSRIFRLSYVL